MAATKFHITLNDIHTPSVSFNESIDRTDPLAIGVLNGKVYLSKDFLRTQGWKPGDEFDLTITKTEA